jgi:hypothetical protein
MIAEGVVHGTTSPPTRLDVAKWVDTAMLEMKGEVDIIRNAWKRLDFEWFLDEPIVDAPVEQDAGGNDDGAEGAL